MEFKIVLGIVYMAVGLFSTLSGFKVLHPFKNNRTERDKIQKYQLFYRYGGILIIIYGLYTIIKFTNEN